MIEYIKDYGITNIEYEYILRDLKREYIDILDIEEENVKEVLNYYNSLDIKEDLYNIIMNRFDLIINNKQDLISKLSNIDLKLFKLIIKNNIENLVMFGI